MFVFDKRYPIFKRDVPVRDRDRQGHSEQLTGR
jgi:hypothetical protein